MTFPLQSTLQRSKTPTIKNAVLKRDIWKQSPIVCTAKTEALEIDNDIHYYRSMRKKRLWCFYQWVSAFSTYEKGTVDTNVWCVFRTKMDHRISFVSKKKKINSPLQKEESWSFEELKNENISNESWVFSEQSVDWIESSADLTSTCTTTVWLMPNSSWTVTSTTAVPDKEVVDTWPILLTVTTDGLLEGM